MTASLDPSPFDVLLSFDPLVPGEDRTAYEALRQHMLNDLSPEGALEAIWAADIIELTWQRRQYTRLRVHIIASARRAMLWSLLKGNLKSGSPAYKRFIALLDRWERQDPDAVAHVEARLNQKGYDSAVVVVQAHRDRSTELDPLEKATAALERRRERLLREVERHKAFATRVRTVARQYECDAAGPGEDKRLRRPPSQAEIARNLREGRH